MLNEVVPLIANSPKEIALSISDGVQGEQVVLVACCVLWDSNGLEAVCFEAYIALRKAVPDGNESSKVGL